MPEEKMTYKGSGVDYDAMDPFKRSAQLAARGTARFLHRFGLKEVERSRGESAYLIEFRDFILAHVEEGLGTKNLVADAMYELTEFEDKTYYDQVAQCCVAMIVNDIITLGALPISVAMHHAPGGSAWFNDERRSQELIKGWKEACVLARCTWAGGETPTLKGIVYPETTLLSGSAIGIISPKRLLMLGDDIMEGDAIILFESSGIHANGLTLAREITDKLPKGYMTELSNGRTYGDTLLEPTIIYVSLIEECQDADIPINYAVNITGHGWRKLMRATKPFNYVIEKIPDPQPIFRFIQENGPVDDKEMYSNYNMGAGFAFFVAEKDVLKALTVAEKSGYKGIRAGYIEKSKQEKRVIIKPKNIEYTGKTLGVR